MQSQRIAWSPLFAVALALGGCDAWSQQKYTTYCDATGCYTCDERGCTPTGGASGRGSCRTSRDCAEGCYCDAQSGMCVEAGFCDSDADCGVNMVCDVARHSCEPASIGTAPAPDAGTRMTTGTGAVDMAPPNTGVPDLAGNNNNGGTPDLAGGNNNGGTPDMAGTNNNGGGTPDMAGNNNNGGGTPDMAGGNNNNNNGGADGGKTTGTQCTADCDCKLPGQSCVNGNCVIVNHEQSMMCVFNYECGAAAECVNGMCHKACTTNAACGTGDTCQGGYCFPNPKPTGGCVWDSDCSGGDVCINGACHAPCQANTDCANAADFCDHNLCQPDWRRVPQCTIDANCPSGQECVDAFCRTRCWSNADCGSCMGFPICNLGYCMSQDEITPMCMMQSQCASGQSCVNATCK